jgi:hypothetical protein
MEFLSNYTHAVPVFYDIENLEEDALLNFVVYVIFSANYKNYNILLLFGYLNVTKFTT